MNIKYLFVLLISVGLVACGDDPAPASKVSSEVSQSKPVLIATNYPLHYFATEIAGNSAEIVLPEMAGDPADWKPDSAAISQIQDANLILLNGAGYESWLSWVTVPGTRLVDTSKGISERLIPLTEETVHQHGPGGEHSHSGHAFTVWLDPTLAIEQATAIEKAISAQVPENTAEHQANLRALVARLEQLDQDLAAAFDSAGEVPLLFSHPVYQYLESRYGLNGVSVHWEPEESPGSTEWIDLQNMLRGHPARLMIWEDQPLDSTAEQLGQLGIELLVFQTASNRPAEGNYFDVMADNIERLQLQCCGTTIDPSE